MHAALARCGAPTKCQKSYNVFRNWLDKSLERHWIFFCKRYSLIWHMVYFRAEFFLTVSSKLSLNCSLIFLFMEASAFVLFLYSFILIFFLLEVVCQCVCAQSVQEFFLHVARPKLYPHRLTQMFAQWLKSHLLFLTPSTRSESQLIKDIYMRTLPPTAWNSSWGEALSAYKLSPAGRLIDCIWFPLTITMYWLLP